MNIESSTRWARDWFACDAYCPKCKDDQSMHTVRSDCRGASTIDTWACSCGHRWKIELREAAALASADAKEGDWIERHVQPPDAEVLQGRNEAR